MSNTVLGSASEGPRVLNITVKHFMTGLTAGEFDLSRLVTPPEYTKESP